MLLKWQGVTFMVLSSWKTQIFLPPGPPPRKIHADARERREFPANVFLHFYSTSNFFFELHSFAIFKKEYEMFWQQITQIVVKTFDV